MYITHTPDSKDKLQKSLI